MKDYIEEIMIRSGFSNRLSILVSLRGPLNIRFEGTWLKYPYIAYTSWVEFVCLINLITIGIQFLMPGMDVVDRCFTGFPFFSLSLGFFRAVYLFLHRERFATLMKEYDGLYKDNPQLEADISYYATVIRIIPLLLILLTAAPMAPWCFMPFINSMMGGEWSISVPSYWPFDPFRNLSTFITVIILQSFAAGYTCLRVILFDNMFYVYACRQLALTAHLKRELERILQGKSQAANGDGKLRWVISVGGQNDPGTTRHPSIEDGKWKIAENKEEMSQKMIEELHIWTVNHQTSLRLAKELQALYSPSLLYQFAMITINLCTDAFVVVYGGTDLLNVFLCFLYIIGNSMELLITCVIGDLITYESNKLEKASLGSQVYLLDPYIYKYWLKMILTRARMPIRLSALGIFPLNTGTFKDIMITAYSFFTLLKSMKERN